MNEDLRIEKKDYFVLGNDQMSKYMSVCEFCVVFCVILITYTIVVKT